MTFFWKILAIICRHFFFQLVVVSQHQTIATGKYFKKKLYKQSLTCMRFFFSTVSHYSHMNTIMNVIKIEEMTTLKLQLVPKPLCQELSSWTVTIFQLYSKVESETNYWNHNNTNLSRQAGMNIKSGAWLLRICTLNEHACRVSGNFMRK